MSTKHKRAHKKKKFYSIEASEVFMDQIAKYRIALGFAILFGILWLTTWFLFAYQAVHPTLSTCFEIQPKEYLDDMHYLAQHVSSQIHERGIPISIACGTALGAARQGSALQHDDDVDFFIKKQDAKEVENILRQDPTCYNIHKTSFGLQFNIRDRKSYCDIFFLSKQLNSKIWKYTGNSDQEWDYFTDEDWECIEKLPYGGGEAVQLKYPEAYLTRCFGKDWKTLVVVKAKHGSKRYPLYKGLDIVGVLSGKYRVL